MKPMFISSFAGLLAAIIASFFVFAIQGLSHLALGAGLLAIFAMAIHAITLPSPKATTPFFSPSHSTRVKSKRMRLQNA